MKREKKKKEGKKKFRLGVYSLEKVYNEAAPNLLFLSIHPSVLSFRPLSSRLLIKVHLYIVKSVSVKIF